MRAAEEICGATIGEKHLEKKTRWWKEEVQDGMRRKMNAFTERGL